MDLKIYCLQKEFLPEDLESVVHADNLVILNDKIQDFSDTAAIASHLDLVISTCTSVPHLTCAMGIPTWILLSYTPDFRWMLGRNDSPWYPSATLFRQPKPGDWSGVLSEVNTALKKYSFR